MSNARLCLLCYLRILHVSQPISYSIMLSKPRTLTHHSHPQKFKLCNHCLLAEHHTPSVPSANTCVYKRTRLVGGFFYLIQSIIFFQTVGNTVRAHINFMITIAFIWFSTPITEREIIRLTFVMAGKTKYFFSILIEY